MKKVSKKRQIPCLKTVTKGCAQFLRVVVCFTFHLYVIVITIAAAVVATASTNAGGATTAGSGSAAAVVAVISIRPDQSELAHNLVGK